MQLNPARGRKLFIICILALPHLEVYAAQPREGTETKLTRCDILGFRERFMQLNPARGRKLDYKGLKKLNAITRFMQLNPARGRKRPMPCDSLAGL